MTNLPEIPTELRELMAEIGPQWATDTKGHVRLMIDKFSEVLRHSPTEGVQVETGNSYGPHERQTFEVFHPAASDGAARPGLIFVHGGAFTEGSRHRTEQIYANVLYYFARHGIVGINAGYRLAPEARYPVAIEQGYATAQWIVREGAARKKEDGEQRGNQSGRQELTGALHDG